MEQKECTNWNHEHPEEQVVQTVFKEDDSEVKDQIEVEDQIQKNEKLTTIGLTENVAGLLCYVFVMGIIFLVIEKENRFVRFHAIQSIFTTVFFVIISMILSLIPIVGLLISLLLFPVGLILWIVLMLKAYQGKLFKLPIIGDLAEGQLK